MYRKRESTGSTCTNIYESNENNMTKNLFQNHRQRIAGDNSVNQLYTPPL